MIGAELWRDRVNRVEEQDAGRGSSRLFENFPQRPLGFAQPLRVQLRTIDGDERDLLFSRKRSRHGGLSGARRSRQQNAPRRRQSNLLIDFVVHVRMLDHGIEQPLHLVETSQGRKRRSALLNKEFASRAGLDFLQSGKKIIARNLQRSEFSRRGAIGFERDG